MQNGGTSGGKILRIKSSMNRRLNICDQSNCFDPCAIQWVIHGTTDELIELCKKHWDQFNREEDMDGKFQVTL